MKNAKNSDNAIEFIVGEEYIYRRRKDNPLQVRYMGIFPNPKGKRKHVFYIIQDNREEKEFAKISLKSWRTLRRFSKIEKNGR
jgi:hypothetical protein